MNLDMQLLRISKYITMRRVSGEACNMSLDILPSTLASGENSCESEIKRRAIAVAKPHPKDRYFHTHASYKSHTEASCRTSASGDDTLRKKVLLKHPDCQ